MTRIAGVAIVFKPAPVYSTPLTVNVLAVLTRGLVGLALLFCSSSAKFPITFQVIGWVSLAMLLDGRTRFKNLIGWAVNLSPLCRRSGGLLAILFASFLLHGVV